MYTAYSNFRFKRAQERERVRAQHERQEQERREEVLREDQRRQEEFLQENERQRQRVLQLLRSRARREWCTKRNESMDGPIENHPYAYLFAAEAETELREWEALVGDPHEWARRGPQWQPKPLWEEEKQRHRGSQGWEDTHYQVHLREVCCPSARFQGAFQSEVFLKDFNLID